MIAIGGEEITQDRHPVTNKSIVTTIKSLASVMRVRRTPNQGKTPYRSNGGKTGTLPADDDRSQEHGFEHSASSLLSPPPGNHGNMLSTDQHVLAYQTRLRFNSDSGLVINVFKKRGEENT